MTIRDISEVGARLEKAVKPLIEDSMTPQEIYDLYEMTAIQILDSEFDDWFGDDLQIYLEGYLEAKEEKLGLNLDFE